MSTFLIYFSSDNATFSRDTSPPKLSLYFFLCLAWRNTMSMRTEQRVSHICAFSLERLCRSGQSLYAFTFVFIKALFLNMYVIFMIEWKILCVYRVLCDFLVWSLNSTAKGFQGPSPCHTWSYVNTYLYFNYLCSARCFTQTWDCASISVIFLLTNS